MVDYDLVIVGAGPAGLAAGLFAGRRKLKTAILEGQIIGGQMTYATKIENYPGIIEARGIELVERMRAQAQGSGCLFIKEQAIEFGFMSGESNVIYWLPSRGIEATDGLIQHVFDVAKTTDHILTDQEVYAAIESYKA